MFVIPVPSTTLNFEQRSNDIGMPSTNRAHGKRTQSIANHPDRQSMLKETLSVESKEERSDTGS